MKKLTAIVLSLVMAFAMLPFAVAADAPENDSFGAYEHVFILGIDGAGRFFKDADTPNFDRIFADGAIDYHARTEVKTDSAPNWTAMLTGVSMIKHGLQNSDVGEVERTAYEGYPTIFTYTRMAKPDAELASFVHWTPINTTIIEKDADVYKYNNGDDAVVTQAVVDYLDGGNAPTVFFLQLDSVDGVGHGKGSTSQEFLDQINLIDGYIGQIYDAIERNGLLESSLIILVADHGHTRHGGHGGLTLRESQVTFAAAGKTVASGGKMDCITRNRDVAAAALYALGIEKPDCMTARIPNNFFEGVPGEIRPLHKDPGDAILSALSWVLTLFTAAF